jgi:hypothetical protein
VVNRLKLHQMARVWWRIMPRHQQNNTGRSRGRKVRWVEKARCCHHLADMRARLDTKQVDRFKAFFRTRMPFAKSIMVVYRYRVVACCFCPSVVASRQT